MPLTDLLVLLGLIAAMFGMMAGSIFGFIYLANGSRWP
jgi:hypothetical protein